MWLLIIATTFYAHGAKLSDQTPTIYQFQEFKTQKRCEQIKKWVIKREGERIKNKSTTVECVKND
jgi:hypothetical protein